MPNDMPAADQSDAAQIGQHLAALCDWAAHLPDADIPAGIMARAAVVLCDDIAAIVAARNEPEVVQLQGRLVSRGGFKETTVFNRGADKSDRFSAAVANAAAADWCELDEGYRRATCHAGLYTIPALIAEAEASGVSTRSMVRSLVLGYEIVARFARAFPPRSLVLHPHASLAAVGAAAAVGSIRRLDARTLLAAVASASTMVAPGPYRHAVEGALVRNVWPAAGAWCGMQAVEWAECGIGGTPQSPYHVFVTAFGHRVLPAQLTEDLGQDWALSDGYQKIHACCQYSHSTVEAILDLRTELGDRIGSARRIVVETHPLGMTLDNRHPETSLAAKFSIPHIAAAACLFGHAGADAFASADLHAPALAALRVLVELAPFAPLQPWPNDRPARVRIVLQDGSEHVRECQSARGGPDRPFEPATIVQKINGIMEQPFPAAPGVMGRLMANDAATLDSAWRAVVAEFTARAT